MTEPAKESKSEPDQEPVQDSAPDAGQDEAADSGQDGDKPFPAWEDRNDLPVGEILRGAREYYNLSIKDVERGLRIRAMHLSAVEEGRFEQLPGRAYAIGFVRAYAEYLGLDGDRIIDLFKTQSAMGSAPRKPLTLPVPASESRIPNLLVLGLCGAVLVGLAAALTMMSGGDSVRHDIPKPVYPPDALKNTSAADMPLQTALVGAIEKASGGKSPVVLVAPQTRIVIRALDSAWVEIRNAANKPLLSRILKAGDSYMVPDEEGLVMDTGNAGVLEFVIDGQPAPKLGEAGDIRRNIMLDADMLKEGRAMRKTGR